MGARVLVFPELSLTGYEMGLASQLALTMDDQRLRPLRDAATQYNITLVVGAPLRVNTNLHIAALIIGTDGQVGVYTKQHLGTFPQSAGVDGTVPPGEPSVFTKGEHDPLVHLDDHIAAIAVCADANRPNHAAAAAARGADTYLVSSFVIPSEFRDAAENLHARAKQHRMAVAFANYGAPTGQMTSAGQSSFWSEDGELLHRLDRQGTGVLVATEHGGVWRTQVQLC